MYVACSSLCFSRYSLTQALKTISELQFQKVDLAIHDSGGHLTPHEATADINRTAQMLRRSNLTFAAFHVEMAAPGLPAFRDTLRSICKLGRMLTVPVVNIAAAPLGSDMDEETERLAVLHRAAEAEGVILTIETHSKTLTAEPASALELCRRIPGLGLTLDPSHYMVGPEPNVDYDQLYPYVRHVRLRDSAPNRWQVRVGQGQLEYGRIITLLERQNYQRALSVDIHDQGDPDGGMEPEVRKLKYLLESMV